MVKDGIKTVLAELPEELHRAVKSEAALRGVKLNDVIVKALEHWKYELESATEGSDY